MIYVLRNQWLTCKDSLLEIVTTHAMFYMYRPVGKGGGGFKGFAANEDQYHRFPNEFVCSYAFHLLVEDRWMNAEHTHS